MHGGDYLADAAPLPQILAMLIMAVSGILMGYIVYERTTFSGWELAVLSILGLNPYFLGCVSFRFDAPYMALSVLAAVVPLLYRNRNTAAYVLASGLGILAVCTSYQAAAGIFPMLVVALALRMWNRGESIREVGLFCLKSAREINRLAVCCQRLCQTLSLRDRSWESIQNIAVLAVSLMDPVKKHADRYLVRY